MMKLSSITGHKPVSELPMLFQRILSNCTLDWFRRQKTRNALFSNMRRLSSRMTWTAIRPFGNLTRRTAPTRLKRESQTERPGLACNRAEIQVLPHPSTGSFLMVIGRI